ncbi:MAG: PEP-CTERM sorting domain-containing protein [Azoarcus sp.]|nr:PEP-CTERM sorting domain-containing protein [Azoarcus sp.]
MQNPPSRIKPIVLSLGMACLGLPLMASAAPAIYGNFTLDAEYIIGASSGPKQDGMSDAATSIYPYSNGGDMYLWKSVGSNGVFFHTYGYDDTHYGSSFGARASGDGSFFTSTSVNYNAAYTNTSSVAQNFTFTFGVQEGELGINGIGAAVAELLLRIRINGVDVARDQTTLVQDAFGARSCTSSDLGLLADYMDCGSVYGNSVIAAGRNYTLDLGLIAAGESFTLDYDIVSTAYGDLSEGETTYNHYVCDEWEDGYGYGDGYGDGYGHPMPTAMAMETPGGCVSGHYETYTYTAPGNAIARSGDPINTYWAPAGISATFASVPEPSSIALLGLAFAGLSVTGRRKLRGRA